MFFKMKTEMPSEGTTVKVKILEDKGLQPADQWGNVSHRYEILANGQEMTWDASPTAIKGMEEIQATLVDDEFVIKRWDKNGKCGFNYFPPNDINVQSQNVTPKQLTPIPVDDKVNRGASLNLSAQYALYKTCGGTLNVEDWWKVVTETAEIISPLQKGFVNNEKGPSIDDIFNS